LNDTREQSHLPVFKDFNIYSDLRKINLVYI